MTIHIPHINATDPSRTASLRSRWVADFARRFRLLITDIKEALVDYDVLGLVERDRLQVMSKHLNITARQFDFPTNSEKIQAFADWVKEQVNLYFLTGGKQGFNLTGQVNVGADTAQDSWMDLYLDSAYQQGIKRGRQELKKQGIDVEATGALGTSGEGSIRAAFNTPLHADRVGMIYTRSFSRLKGITASIDSLVSDVLAIGIAEGKGPREIASAMTRALTGKGEDFGITDSLGRFIPPKRRAEMLARTEVIRAHHAANMAEYRAAGAMGIKVEAEYVSRSDACPQCKPLDGKIYSLDEAENLIPVHPQCVTSDSVIFAPDVKYLMKSKYTGRLFEITTASGVRLTVTPNHMLLTSNGLVPAKFLTNRSDVLNCSIGEWITFCDPYDKNNPARIDNIFSSLLISCGSSSSRMPVSTIDFHGDGKFCQDEINIVRADSFLRDYYDSIITNGCNDRYLKIRGIFDILFSGGTHTEFFEAAFSSPGGFVGLCREFFSFLRGCLAHSKKHTLASVPWYDSTVFEDSVDNIPRDFMEFCETFSRHTGVKLVNDDITRYVDFVMGNSSSDFKSMFDKLVFNSVSLGKPVNFGDCSKRFSRHIKTVGIKNIRSFHADSIDVYDVSTMSTGYIVNGILSSNCRCVAVPHISG